MTTLILAPMEGLLDHGLRRVLTGVGGVDRCVSEFIRVTSQLLPRRAFLRIVPELQTQSRTASGVPVRPQLLGSDPACVADNAARLAEMGAAGIDLNFGCPAKTVNRHRGGAVLLNEPELIHAIVAAVRCAVPAAVPVAAKMRLGVDDTSRLLDCAYAIASGGAAEIAVHARTKAQGYRPPAHWEEVARVREAVTTPVIANGEIWTAQDARQCLAVTGCDALMLGRGMVARPALALAIRQLLASPADAAKDGGDNAVTALPWRDVLPLIALLWQDVRQRVAPRHQAGRIKQWLLYLARAYPEARRAFGEVRTATDPGQIGRWLERASAEGA